MTGVATMLIKIAFLSSVSSACINVWRCVATFFSDSTCYYCITSMHLLLLRWSRIKKEWMNEFSSLECLLTTLAKKFFCFRVSHKSLQQWRVRKIHSIHSSNPSISATHSLIFISRSEIANRLPKSSHKFRKSANICKPRESTQLFFFFIADCF